MVGGLWWMNNKQSGVSEASTAPSSYSGQGYSCTDYVVKVDMNTKKVSISGELTNTGDTPQAFLIRADILDGAGLT